MALTLRRARTRIERQGASRWFVEVRFPNASVNGSATRGYRLAAQFVKEAPLGKALKNLMIRKMLALFL